MPTWKKLPAKNRKPAVRKPPEKMTPAQYRKEASKGIDERKHVQTPSVAMGRQRGWVVLELGKFALTRHNADGDRISNPIMNTKGTPDTYWAKNGMQFFIEFKKPGGKLSPHQVALITELRQQGVLIYVFDSVGQVYDLLAGIDPPKHAKFGHKQVVV